MNLAMWLLGRLLPADWRESIAGDLEEERHRRIAAGRPAGAWWALRSALLTIFKLSIEARRSTRPPAPRPTWRTRGAVLSDVRFAIRSLRASPGFVAAVLAVLTLGIGASTAIFSVVDAVVLRGMPFDEADRLVVVGEVNVKAAVPLIGGAAAPNYFDWKAQQHVFQSMAATVVGRGFIVRDGGREGRPEDLRALQTTASLFDVLRARPRLGHAFTEHNEIPGNQRVAVISDGLWHRRFGADPDVVGKTITFDKGAWEIVGVMPPDFTYPVGVARPTDLWVPYAVTEQNDKSRTAGRNYYLRVVARLNDDATIVGAQAQMDTITRGLALRFPAWFDGQAAVVQSLQDATVGRVRAWMLMLLGAVGLVLLIACANVANLMLARVTTRWREMGIRAALGASRWQIARGLLIESLVLSVAGTACAVLAASWGVGLLRAVLPATIPRVASVAIDLRVLSAAALAAVATGLLFGLAPALQFSRPDLKRVIGDGGRSGTAGYERQRLRALLVISEVALAVVLLVGAGLFVSSFMRLVRVDLGLDYQNVLTIGVNPRLDTGDPKAFDAARDRTPSLVAEVLTRVRAIPGVAVASALSGGTPLSGSSYRNVITVAGAPPYTNDADQVFINQVTPEYGQATRASVKRGRYLGAADIAGAPLVVVLNEESVRRFFGGRDPIGAVIQLDDASRLVVGIVGDVRLGGPEALIRPEAYVPFAQASTIGATLVIRTIGDPAAVAVAVRQAVQAALPDVPVPEPTTLESSLQGLLAQRKFNMLLIGLFGVLAVAIAAVGIYGVMAYTVAQRTKEIGLRMALGAQPRSVLRLILGHASVFMGLGLGTGLVAAWLLARLVTTFLFDVRPHDPAVYLSVGVLIVASGLLAALIPAIRAARVDPMVSLRAD